MAFKGNMIQEVSPGCLSSTPLPFLLLKRIVAQVHTDGGSAPIDPAATIDDLPGARPTGFSVNFPLIAQTAESGATEYWPGTHRDLGLKHGLADPAGRFATAQMREDYEAKQKEIEGICSPIIQKYYQGSGGGGAGGDDDEDDDDEAHDEL